MPKFKGHKIIGYSIGYYVNKEWQEQGKAKTITQAKKLHKELSTTLKIRPVGEKGFFSQSLEDEMIGEGHGSHGYATVMWYQSIK